MAPIANQDSLRYGGRAGRAVPSAPKSVWQQCFGSLRRAGDSSPCHLPLLLLLCAIHTVWATEKPESSNLPPAAEAKASDKSDWWSFKPASRPPLPGVDK